MFWTIKFELMEGCNFFNCSFSLRLLDRISLVFITSVPKKTWTAYIIYKLESFTLYNRKTVEATALMKVLLNLRFI